jgi:hypothetical protein
VGGDLEAAVEAIYGPEGGTVWCARVWMRGTAQTGILRVIRNYTLGIPEVDVDVASNLSNDSWTRVPAVGAKRITIRPDGDILGIEVVIPNSRQGDYLLFDDMEYWQTKDGLCDER